MNAKDIHDIEQASQDIVTQLVPVLASYFKSCIDNGFTREEALALTRDHQEILLGFRNKNDG